MSLSPVSHDTPRVCLFSLPTEDSTGEVLLDFRKMAAVGNGHVATVVYSPTVYMNGLYNGPVGKQNAFVYRPYLYVVSAR